MEADPEFWKALRFALECGTPSGEDPDVHQKKMLESQTKYSWDDIRYILIPVLGKFEFTTAPYPWITPDGLVALATLHEDGRIPDLDFKRHDYTDAQILTEAERRADCSYYEEDDRFESDPEGYVEFFHTMLDLDRVWSNYCAFGRYIWTQIYAILRGEKPPVRDILAPLLGERGMHNPKLRAFLEEHLKKGEEEFEHWYRYAEHTCPVL